MVRDYAQNVLWWPQKPASASLPVVNQQLSTGMSLDSGLFRRIPKLRRWHRFGMQLNGADLPGGRRSCLSKLGVGGLAEDDMRALKTCSL